MKEHLWQVVGLPIRRGDDDLRAFSKPIPVKEASETAARMNEESNEFFFYPLKTDLLA